MPTFWIWIYAFVATIAPILAAPHGQLPKRADLAAQFVLPFIMAWWVMADAQKRGRRLCYDYDTFVYFAWPVAVPVYLFQTRGKRAVLTLLYFAGIWMAAWIAGWLVSLIG